VEKDGKVYNKRKNIYKEWGKRSKRMKEEKKEN
jgi:hypothetical protein